MKINLEELRNRKELINEKKHDYLDLILWNYNQTCQFDRKWDEYTSITRGLITDLEGNIISRPFKKFFNYGEGENQLIPTKLPIVLEKIDGSLGIQYYDKENVLITTRGSFNSEQAIKACNIMRIKGLKKHNFIEGYTYLYEIIYPENRIVVNYGDKEELILLSVINTETGEESFSLLQDEARRLGFNTPKKFEINSINDIIDKVKTLGSDEEGYVFYWSDDNYRIKIKGEEYVRLHKLLTEFSTISIWEILANGKSLEELLDRVPDEFFQWVKKQKEILEFKFTCIKKTSNEIYNEIKYLSDRKSQATKVMSDPINKIFSSFVFKLLDGKEIDSLIWKKIRPKFEKPFLKSKECL